MNLSHLHVEVTLVAALALVGSTPVGAHASQQPTPIDAARLGAEQDLSECWTAARTTPSLAVTCADGALTLSETALQLAIADDATNDFAVRVLEQAIAALPRRDPADRWAFLHSNLALAHARFQSARAAHYAAARRAAIEAESVLRALMQANSRPCGDDECRERVRETQQWFSVGAQNLARVLLDDPSGDLAADVERARTAANDALAVAGERAAADRVNLHVLAGRALMARPRGQRAENIELAVGAFEAAVEAGGPDCSCYVAKLELARAYVERLGGDQVYNRSRALRLAREVRSAVNGASPDRAAISAEPLALVEQARAQVGIDDRSAVADATAVVNGLAQMRGVPLDVLIEARRMLAAAYVSQGTTGGGDSVLAKAVEQLERALTEATRADAPRTVARLRQELAHAIIERDTWAGGDDQRGLRRAVEALEAARPILEADRSPLPLAMLAYDRGRALIAEGERAPSASSGSALVREGIGELERALALVEDQELVPFKTTIRVELGNFFFHRGLWNLANQYYEQALQHVGSWMAPQLSFTPAGRRWRLALLRDVSARSAYSLLQMGAPMDAANRLQQGQAVELALEHGTAMYAAADSDRSLDVGIRDLHRLESAWALAPFGSRESVDAGAQLRTARRELQARVDAQIKATPDPDLNLRQALISSSRPGGATVITLVTSKGGALFVIPYGVTAVTGDHVIPVAGLTDRTALDLVLGPDGWMRAMMTYRERSSSIEARNRWMSDIERIGSRAWTVLGQPILDALRLYGLRDGAPVTIVLPNGPMAWLPLQAATRQVGASRRALSDDFEITYSPSVFATHVAKRAAERASRTTTLLGVVNPTGDSRFESLETTGLQSLFPASGLTLLVGPRATVAELASRLGRSRYLHLSAHGVFDPVSAARTGLVLAPGTSGGDRAMLSSAEIPAYVNATGLRVVTLSACESGLPELSLFHQEWAGLPAAFMKAGAPAVVASTWKVSDLPSDLLMLRFYDGLVRRQLEPATALRAAQQWLRDATAQDVKALAIAAGFTGDVSAGCVTETAECRPFSSPFYWAAFIILGF